MVAYDRTDVCVESECFNLLWYLEVFPWQMLTSDLLVSVLGVFPAEGYIDPYKEV